MRAQRLPRGGERGLRSLRDSLVHAPLQGLALKKFRQTDKIMRETIQHLRNIPQSSGEMSIHDETSLGVPLGIEATPTNINAGNSGQQGDPETMALWSLGVLAWRTEFENELCAYFRKLRSEQNRTTLRIMYATLHNLEQYADTPHFAQDANLARFRVISAVPYPDDPLASFNSVEVVENLAGELSKQLLDFNLTYSDLSITANEVVAYLRRFATCVANDARAGEMPPPVRPSSREIMTAIEEARREQLPPDVKRALVERLSAQLEQTQNKERNQINAAQEERQQLNAAIDAFFIWLTDLLPQSFGGKRRDPATPNQVINAENPKHQLSELNPNAEEIVVRLVKAGGINLRGLALGWKNNHEDWVLELGGQEHLIQDGLELPFGSHTLRLFVLTRGGTQYMLLRLDARESNNLWSLLARARCVATMISPSRDFQNLRLARACVGWLRDRRVDATANAPASSERYAIATEDSLASFAKNGADKLLERFAKSPDAKAIGRAFAMTGEAFDEEKIARSVEVLSECFSSAINATDMTVVDGVDINFPGDVVSFTYHGEPVTVRVMGIAFTIRLDNLGRMTVAAAGANRPIDDILVRPIGSGYAVFARDGMGMSVGYAAVETED